MTPKAAFIDPDGRLTEISEVQFLEEWHLTRLDFDVTGAGKTVTAIIDVGNFPTCKTTRRKARNGTVNSPA